MVDEVVAIASEQERLEAWILREVEAGATLPGLYPPNDSSLARYAAAPAQTTDAAPQDPGSAAKPAKP
jgi:hypothetical protein